MDTCLPTSLPSCLLYRPRRFFWWVNVKQKTILRGIYLKKFLRTWIFVQISFVSPIQKYYMTDFQHFSKRQVFLKPSPENLIASNIKYLRKIITCQAYLYSIIAAFHLILIHYIGLLSKRAASRRQSRTVVLSSSNSHEAGEIRSRVCSRQVKKL